MSTKANNKNRNISGKYIRNGALIGTGTFGVLLLIYLLAAFYYKNHFYTNTEINGVKTSNMTVDKAEEAITSEVKSYRLIVEGRNGIKDAIDGKDIDLHTVIQGGVSDLLKKQNMFAWPASLFKHHNLEIKTMVKYDKTLLEKHIQNLSCFDETNIKLPENATVSEYGDNGFEIIPEKEGTQVDEDKMYQAVVKAIDNLEPTLSIEKADCYVKPKINSKSPELFSVLEQMNKIASAKITYQFGENTEVVDGSKISKWLSVDKKGKVKLDSSKVKEFVDYIGKTYNSFGRIRTFKTSYGDVVKVKGGDYGWWLNRPEEVKALTKLIKSGKKVKRDPSYFQTAQQHGKDDIGDTYVEINLSAQHLFFYKDGKLIVESDFVSGNVSKRLGTPVGTYPLQYKENDATLVGEDYSTPVKYWMPFNRNIGLHDAPWRHGQFGKDIFMTNGSHGCVNMPPAAAKKMFQYIQRGVAIVVYELPGTENYDPEKYRDIVARNNSDNQNLKKDNTEKTSQ